MTLRQAQIGFSERHRDGNHRGGSIAMWQDHLERSTSPSATKQMIIAPVGFTLICRKSTLKFVSELRTSSAARLIPGRFFT